MAALCRAAGVSPVPNHWAWSVTSQIAMVECGLGVTVVPATASASHPAVRFRPLRDATTTIELTTMTRSQPGALAERLTALATQLRTAPPSEQVRPRVAPRGRGCFQCDSHSTFPDSDGLGSVAARTDQEDLARERAHRCGHCGRPLVL